MRFWIKNTLFFRKSSNPSSLWGRIGGGLLFALFLFGCEDQSDYRYPSVITDYTCLITDEREEPYMLRLDNGRSYPIEFDDEAYDGAAYKADTTYRIVSTYELNADSIAYVYAMAQTVSMVPTSLHDGETLHQDPAYLQSCWLSGGFLNMVIELKALDGKHYIGFIDTTPEGMQGKEITFYHHAEDIESHRKKLYGSIPLNPSLQQGDTLRFVINTYDKGVTRREFVL